MKTSIYLIVFGIIVLLIAASALSTTVFNKSLSSKNATALNLTDYGKAPALAGLSGWINSQPLNISSLKGKVVIIDFWTYSCINCIRSIPHLNAWYNAYGDNGLVIIGVHTPEFPFEHNYSNVYGAVQRFGIRYPVALDNNYSTWDAYGNEYWPADYIIDKNGDIRYEVFGEGNYNQTEAVIRSLLTNAGYAIQPNFTDVPLGVNFGGIGTPEIYLGYARERQALGNTNGFKPNSTVDYQAPDISKNNTAYLSGKWYNAPDSMVAVNNSKIFLVYKAAKVNIVASGNDSRIIVRLDGKNLTESEIGSAVNVSGGEALGTIGSPRLYNIVSTQSYGWHLLEIDASPGFRIYTFTFG